MICTLYSKSSEEEIYLNLILLSSLELDCIHHLILLYGKAAWRFCLKRTYYVLLQTLDVVFVLY